MIEIRINGDCLALPYDANIQQALAQYLDEQQQSLSFAVALNSDFVPRSEYDKRQLKANDSLDVLFPIFGG